MLSGLRSEEYPAGVPTKERSKGIGTAITVWGRREKVAPKRAISWSLLLREPFTLSKKRFP